MTNSFFVAVFVLWSTNTMDTLSPSGDEKLSSKITVRTDVYTLPGQSLCTNVVAVATNSDHWIMQWVKLPPVPVTITNK